MFKSSDCSDIAIGNDEGVVASNTCFGSMMLGYCAHGYALVLESFLHNETSNYCPITAANLKHIYQFPLNKCILRGSGYYIRYSCNNFVSGTMDQSIKDLHGSNDAASVAVVYESGNGCNIHATGAIMYSMAGRTTNCLDRCVKFQNDHHDDSDLDGVALIAAPDSDVNISCDGFPSFKANP